MGQRKRKAMSCIANLKNSRKRTAGNASLEPVGKENVCFYLPMTSFLQPKHLQESHWHVVQPPSPTPMKALQSTFRCEIGKGSLAARPDVGPTFENFSIITEQLFKHDDIDCDIQHGIV